MKKLTTDKFIENAKKIHGNAYDYSSTVYTISREAVSILCPKHGTFKINPVNHISQKQGCPTCGNLKKSNTKRTNAGEKFPIKAKDIHGEKYDYSCSQYYGAKVPIKILCPEHGEFTQLPNVHLNGSGCPACSKPGFSSNLPGYLYYISINNGQAYKIGITNDSIESRFKVKELETIKVIRIWEYANGYECKQQELKILKEYKMYKYTGPDLLDSGNTELFKVDILGLDNVQTS